MKHYFLKISFSFLILSFTTFFFHNAGLSQQVIGSYGGYNYVAYMTNVTTTGCGTNAGLANIIDDNDFSDAGIYLNDITFQGYWSTALGYTANPNGPELLLLCSAHYAVNQYLVRLKLSNGSVTNQIFHECNINYGPSPIYVYQNCTLHQYGTYSEGRKAAQVNFESFNIPAGVGVIGIECVGVSSRQDPMGVIVLANAPIYDVTPPVITSCSSNIITSTTTGVCGVNGLILPNPIATDNIGVTSITNNAPSQFPVGTTTVTWTISDAAGNSVNCTQLVTVNDTEAPVISCPSATTFNNTPGLCSNDSYTLSTAASATDNCSVFSISNNAPPVLPIGITTVVWTAMDTHGNSSSCNQQITVLDMDPPVLNCSSVPPINNSIGLCENDNVTLTPPIANDNCGIASLTNNAPSIFVVGTTPIMWTAVDLSGNTSSCTQLITVIDNELPSIICNGSVSANSLAGICGNNQIVLSPPTVDDNCGIASISSDAPLQFPVGLTTVTWTVTDLTGNIAQCLQTVTIIDQEAPNMNCIDPLPFNNTMGQCGNSTLFLAPPVVVDNCGISSLINDAPIFFPVGTTSVTWLATDFSGNSATCNQVITVIDNEQPILDCTDSLFYTNTAGLCGNNGIILPVPIMSDNCGITSFVNDGPTFFSVGTTAVNWTVTDINNNTSHCTQVIKVEDIEFPTISCPTPVTENNSLGMCGSNSILLQSPSISDNCSIASLSNNAPIFFPVGVTPVTWLVFDNSGNSAQCIQDITILDSELPTISCPLSETYNNTIGKCENDEISLQVPTANDNCGISSISNNAPSLFPVGTTNVTWTVFDLSNNTATCDQQITVIDAESPIINDIEDIVTCNPIVDWNLNYSDNCGIDSVYSNFPSGFSFPEGNWQVETHVIDIHGNETIESFQITVYPKIGFEFDSIFENYCSFNPIEIELLNQEDFNSFNWYFDNSFYSNVPNLTIENTSILNSGSYTLSAIDTNNCVRDSVIEITINNCSNFIPNAFTPNNHDGKNDVFQLGIKYPNTQIYIYNRWGSLVYWSDNFETWDGTYSGKLLPEGTYYYVISLHEDPLDLNKTNVYKGFVYLKW